MNTAPDTPPLPPSSPEPQLTVVPAELAPPVEPSSPDDPRRNGKISHLPKEQQDLINHLFDQGLTYEAVCKTLAGQGISVNAANLSRWFHGGYQDELRRRERQAHLLHSQERLLELARKDGTPALTLAGLQVAVTQLSEQLYDMAPGTHKDAFEKDPNHYIRMLNTLARMSKAILALQQYQEELAKARAAQLKELDQDRDLNDNEWELLAKRMDRVFHVRRPAAKSPPPLESPDDWDI